MVMAVEQQQRRRQRRHVADAAMTKARRQRRTAPPRSLWPWNLSRGSRRSSSTMLWLAMLSVSSLRFGRVMVVQGLAPLLPSPSPSRRRSQRPRTTVTRAFDTVPPTTRVSHRWEARRREYDDDEYYDYDEYYDEDDYDDSDIRDKTNQPHASAVRDDTRPYWEDDDEDDYSSDKTGIDTGYNNNDDDDDRPVWESCRTPSGPAWVLLPTTTTLRCPTCIVHFVGGTVTGSAPTVWYGPLLQGLVQHTHCAVVATTLPVSLRPDSRPLDHVTLARRQERQFRAAVQDILYDEYGSIVTEVPVCGLGHSLGARVLTVAATLAPDGRSRHDTTSYRAMILCSFVNYGAAAGIPGLAELYRRSRMVEVRDESDAARVDGGRRRRRGYEDSDDSERSAPSSGRRRRRDEDWYDDDDDDDTDWADVWREFTDVVQAGTSRVQTALTPDSASLEFRPTPEQLWQAIASGRYRVPHTLLVQFDDDVMDQSSALATALVESANGMRMKDNNSTTATATTVQDTASHSVRFARLRGTHLTPISVVSNDNNNDDDGGDRSGGLWQSVSQGAGRLLWKGLQRRGRTAQADLALRELRQSLTRYLMDVVTVRDADKVKVNSDEQQ